jgi:hypothetical protein
MVSVSRLLGNIGSADIASNFLMEQRNLMRAQAKENRAIRDLIEQKVSFVEPCPILMLAVTNVYLVLNIQ